MKFFVYMGLIIVALYTSGCLYKPPQLANNSTIASKPPAIKNTGSGPEEIVLESSEEIDSANTEIILYFADEMGNLVPERRTIKKVAGIARATINELCRGPESQGLEPTIPPNTKLLDISIKDGVCVVNLSKELITEHSGGSAAENVTVYSLVNTLSQFQSVESVQILVDGAIVPSIAGHMDTSKPIVRDMALIKSI